MAPALGGAFKVMVIDDLVDATDAIQSCRFEERWHPAGTAADCVRPWPETDQSPSPSEFSARTCTR